MRNMEKDFNILDVKEEISLNDCEEMAMTTLTVQGQIYSEESRKVNVSSPEKDIDKVIINSNETVPYPLKEKGQERINDKGTSFCFVGIKMEKPDDYESVTSFPNSEMKYSYEEYRSSHERDCNVDDQCLEEKLPMKLSDTSCTIVKIECNEDNESCKSDIQINDMSKTIDMNCKFDTMSVVHGCGMEYSNTEFIRGIECQEYPILSLKEEEEEKTDKQIAMNRKNSVKIKEKEKRDDLICSASGALEYYFEECPYNWDEGNKGGNIEGNNKILTVPTVKMESKEVVDACEMNCRSTENIYITKTLENNCRPTIHPVGSEQRVSCDETLEIKFESICDVSQFDIKAEKPFVSGLNSEKVGEFDKKPPILQPLHVILKEEPVELDGMCENQKAKNSYVVNSSKVMRKEGSIALEGVSLQGVYPSHQTQIGDETSVSNKIRRIESINYEKHLTKECREYQKDINCLHHEPVIKTQTEYGLVKPRGVLQKRAESHSFLKPNTCHSSKKTIRRITDLKKHKVNHIGQKSFSCHVCNLLFRTKRNLTVHMRVHSRVKPFSCVTCDASFGQNSSLKTHMRTHTGDKPFSCELCHISFSESGNLKVHLRTHTGEKPFICGICHLSFQTKGNLKVHMNIHTGVKPYSCDVCNVSFIKKWSLKLHMSVHTGEKPFLCATCEASFSRYGDLKRHSRTHTGEKPYSCDMCHLSFSESGNLKVHMRTHTGEKPFSCVVCDLPFRTKGNLNSHMSIHNGKQPYS